VVRIHSGVPPISLFFNHLPGVRENRTLGRTIAKPHFLDNSDLQLTSRSNPRNKRSKPIRPALPPFLVGKLSALPFYEGRYFLAARNANRSTATGKTFEAGTGCVIAQETSVASTATDGATAPFRSTNIFQVFNRRIRGDASDGPSAHTPVRGRWRLETCGNRGETARRPAELSVGRGRSQSAWRFDGSPTRSLGLFHCGKGSCCAKRSKSSPPAFSSNSVCMKRYGLRSFLRQQRS
jgi:hypothetical protein